MNRKILSVLLAFALIAALFTGCVPQGNETPEGSAQPTAPTTTAEVPVTTEKMTLNVLNWGDYMEEGVLEAFRSEYPNITFNYETMTSNEEMLVQLKNENSIYDICFPSDYTISKLVKLNLLAEIDKSKLPNLKNIDERFMNLSFDPENKYSVPYMWGTTGILYNKKMVNEEVDSWSILWDERYAKQIIMYDSVRDTIGITLKKLGYSMNSQNVDELAQAEAELIAQKPLVLAYGVDDIRDKMIGESAAMAITYSGDAILCMDENPELDYQVPKEGGNIWFDNMVILKNSKNKEAAHIFIDFLCRADIAQQNTEYLGYSSPNKAAMANVNEELKNNPVYNPPQEVIDRCEAFDDLGDFMNNYNDAWLRIKAAN